jgi:hypothetical protein
MHPTDSQNAFISSAGKRWHIGHPSCARTDSDYSSRRIYFHRVMTRANHPPIRGCVSARILTPPANNDSGLRSKILFDKTLRLII